MYLLIPKEAVVVSKENDGVVIEFIAGQTVAYSIALHVDRECILALKDPHSQGGHIYTSI